MANNAQLQILKSGVEQWNRWRDDNPDVVPDLSYAMLDNAVLQGANLRRANLRETHLVKADLRETHLQGAKLTGAWLDAVDLSGADLSGADLFGAYLSHAHLQGANLQGASLERVNMINTRLEGADLSGAQVYGISAWDLVTDETTIQDDLVITPSPRAIGRREKAMVVVDDLEVAQFVYLMLNSSKIRNALTVIGKKGVLLLGRFNPPERKAVLDALRVKLRALGYVPLMFDFGRVDDRSFTETIRVLAGLSRFIIADVTDPQSAPLELQATVPDYMVPFAPILLEGTKAFSMLADLQQHSWVMPVKTYRDTDHLLEKLESGIITPALKLHAELQLVKARELQVESLG